MNRIDTPIQWDNLFRLIQPLTFEDPGTVMSDPNRWQPLHFQRQPHRSVRHADFGIDPAPSHAVLGLGHAVRDDGG